MLSKASRHPIARLRTIRLLAAGALCLSSLLPALAPAEVLNLPKVVAPVSSPSTAALSLQTAFIDVAAKLSPVVVNISSEWTEEVNNIPKQLYNFWSYGPNGPPRTSQKKEKALGSGFLVSPEGYIVTNAHVIGKATKVTVSFEDGTTYQGKIVGKDALVDIAVVKITDPNKTFPYAVLGDSDALKVGEWAIAIGNPFGLDHTVTTGVISAKGRSMEVNEEQGFHSFIQTDASINPGNSGGPLCDIEGRVIGINSALYSESGESVGIGFAIPSNIARKAVEDLVNKGKVIRAGLGAIVQGLTPEMSKSFGLGNTEGALLSEINSGSAAEQAGLKAGDIVLSIDGDKVTGSTDLVAKLYTHNPGETVEFTILRNGVRSAVSVTLQELKEEASNQQTPTDQNQPQNMYPSQDRQGPLGFSIQDQTAALKSQLPQGAPSGPVIVDVQQDSPAAAGGLAVGDVVLKLGNTAIVSTKQLAMLLKKSNLKTGVRLYVWRNGEKLFVVLQNGDE